MESSIENENYLRHYFETWIAADVEKEILIENTMNNYVARSVVSGVNREILIEKRSLLYYFYFFLEKVRGFSIENGSYLCWKVFAVRLIF